MFVEIQGWTIRPSPGLVNFVPAVAYHFCLNLPAAFLQPGSRLIVEPCISVLRGNRHGDRCLSCSTRGMWLKRPICFFTCGSRSTVYVWIRIHPLNLFSPSNKSLEALRSQLPHSFVCQNAAQPVWGHRWPPRLFGGYHDLKSHKYIASEAVDLTQVYLRKSSH